MTNAAQRLPCVTMIGGSKTRDPAVLGLAERLGAALKAGGYHLVCGGGAGTMEAACRGFAQTHGPGRSIGILPRQRHDAVNPFIDIALPSGIGYARNALVVQAGQAVVAIGGESGTLSELALAWQFGRPIAVLTAAGGLAAEWAGRAMDEHRGDVIEDCRDLAAVMTWLAAVLEG